MIENFRELWFFIVTSILYMYIKQSLHSRIKLANKVCFCTSLVCLHTCISFQNYTAMDQPLPYSRIWQPLIMNTLCHVLIKLHIFQVTLFAVITFSSSQSVYLSYRWMLFLRCGRSVEHRVWVSSCTCPTQPACGAEVCKTNNKT